MKEEIKKRIISLRTFMKRQGIAAFIIPSTDPHSGEYVPEHWESRKWISGFTGSAGTVVITKDKGGLWTDSRYFLQAAEQLQGSGIDLYNYKIQVSPCSKTGFQTPPPLLNGWEKSCTQVIKLV